MKLRWLLIFLNVFVTNLHAATLTQQFSFMLSNVTYGIFIVNDRYAEQFVTWMNQSVDLVPSPTQNMSILVYEETRQDSNFFVSEGGRRSAKRFLGFFSNNGSEPNSLEEQRVINLFNKTHQQVSAQLIYTGSKMLNLIVYCPSILILSFILHHFLLPHIFANRMKH
ncbi:MAG: hypothetical protein WCK49_02855 [Myxococcaceae bacterium]